MKINLNKTIRKSLNNSHLQQLRLRFCLKNVILFILLSVLVSIVIYPIARLVVKSVIINSDFSFKSVQQLLRIGGLRSIFNTFKLAFTVLVGAWLVGGTMAYISVNTDYRHKKIINTLMFLTFTIPSYILSVSWIQITSRNGYLYRVLKTVFPSMRFDLNTYSIGAAATVLIVHLAPLVFFGLKNSLERLNISLINSARISGASRSQITAKIVLPLMVPSFISTGLLVFSRSLANFGVVAQLALPVGQEVLTTSIFSAVSSLNLGAACVLAVVLMVISLILYQAIDKISCRERYVFRSDQVNGSSFIRLGRVEGLVTSVLSIYFALTLIIPLVTIFLSSFVKRWGVPISLESLTLSNYLKIINGEIRVFRALFNSLSFGLIAGFAAVTIVSLTLFLAKNNRGKPISWALKICHLPIAFPNMILAIAAIFAWSEQPIKLYGTKWIIIITYVVLFMPIILKQVKGMVDNIDTSADKVARTMGIGFCRRFYHLFLPQCKPGLAAGFLTCLLIALREIPVSLLLYTNRTRTMGVMLFTVQSNSYGLEMTSTIAVIIIFLSMTLSLLMRKLNRGRGYDGSAAN